MAARLGRLLIIDDTRAVVDALGEHFAERGFHVQVAFDGRRILDRLRRFRPDGVLLDLRLPGIDGEDVFTVLRLHDATLPVVIISGAGDVEYARHLLRQGAFDYVAKPFDFAYLDRVVDAAIAARTVDLESA